MAVFAAGLPFATVVSSGLRRRRPWSTSPGRALPLLASSRGWAAWSAWRARPRCHRGSLPASALMPAASHSMRPSLRALLHGGRSMPQANFHEVGPARARSALGSCGRTRCRHLVGALAHADLAPALVRLVEPSPCSCSSSSQHVVDIRAAEGVHAVVGGTVDVVQVVVRSSPAERGWLRNGGALFLLVDDAAGHEHRLESGGPSRRGWCSARPVRGGFAVAVAGADQLHQFVGQGQAGGHQQATSLLGRL